MKQGVQARGLKLLARDAREQAEHAGISTADYFCGIAQTGELTRDGVAQFVKSLPDGTTELMCHPGYADAALQKTRTGCRIRGRPSCRSSQTPRSEILSHRWGFA